MFSGLCRLYEIHQQLHHEKLLQQVMYLSHSLVYLIMYLCATSPFAATPSDPVFIIYKRSRPPRIVHRAADPRVHSSFNKRAARLVLGYAARSLQRAARGIMTWLEEGSCGILETERDDGSDVEGGRGVYGVYGIE